MNGQTDMRNPGRPKAVWADTCVWKMEAAQLGRGERRAGQRKSLYVLLFPLPGITWGQLVPVL